MFAPLIAAVAFAQAPNMVEDPRRNYAAGPSDAIMMLPPATVCGATATRLLWTADGKFLVALRMVMPITPEDVVSIAAGTPPKPEAIARLTPRYELVGWNVKGQIPRTLLSVSGGQGALTSVEPMPETNRLLVDFTETVSAPNGGAPERVDTIALLSADTGALTRLSSLPTNDGGANFGAVSMRRPLGFVRHIDEGGKSASVRFFGPEGRLGPALPLPPRAGLTFDNDGLPGYILPKEPGNEKNPVFQFQRIDPQTAKPGAIVPFKKPVEAPPADPELRLASLASVAPYDVATAPAVFLHMKGGTPDEKGIVTTDGTLATLSPNGDAVAYVHQGSAMVRPLVRIPKVVVERARAAAERTRVLGQAKQVGLALTMFANDQNDILPGTDADLRQKLGPYFGNKSMLDGFSYTFGGGSMRDIRDPAATALGYVTGPGGRAVVYADGHVKWMSDGP